MVRLARLNEMDEIASLNNSVIEKPFEEALIVPENKFKQRWEKDPYSILVGILEQPGQPPRLVSLVNNVSLKLKSLQSIPPTHQELTADDTGSNSDPEGNARVCYWVATDKIYGRGWKGEFENRQLSLGQIQVRAVDIAARQAKQNLNGVIAYSRPEGLRRFIEDYYKDKSTSTHFSFPAPGTIYFEVMREGKMARQELKTDRSGVFFVKSGRVSVHPTELMINNFANALDPNGAFYFRAFRLHKGNGARLNLSLVFVNGHPGDQNSLFYRICFVYKWS